MLRFPMGIGSEIGRSGSVGRIASSSSSSSSGAMEMVHGRVSSASCAPDATFLGLLLEIFVLI